MKVTIERMDTGELFTMSSKKALRKIKEMYAEKIEAKAIDEEGFKCGEVACDFENQVWEWFFVDLS